MKKTISPLVLALGIVAAACSAPQPSATPATPPVPPAKEQTWQLVEMRGRAVARTDEAITLVLNPDAGTLRGSAPCNTYYARISLSPTATGYTLGISGLGAGNVQCPEAKMNREQRYLALLSKADGLLIEGYELTLSHNGKPILKYEQQ